jgi:hypothetical protein
VNEAEMVTSRRFLLIVACAFAGSAATAQAEPSVSWDQDTRYELSQRNQDMTLDRTSSLRRDLESAGVLSRTGPYRVALPLASLGEKGPKLLFTYVPRMKDGVGSKVFMLLVRINID